MQGQEVGGPARLGAGAARFLECHEKLVPQHGVALSQTIPLFGVNIADMFYQRKVFRQGINQKL